MARIMALDIGTKRTGIAVTDPSGIIAMPLITVPASGIYEYLKTYFEKEKVSMLVVGLPVGLKGQHTPITALVEKCVQKLKKSFPGLPVYTFDERFTSRMATSSLLESGQSKKTRQDKSVLDKISAAILLQSWLESSTFRNLQL